MAVALRTFRNRSEAGKLLAAQVAGLDLRYPVVLALPRGGVPVAFEVAKALGAPLDLVIVRKVGAPEIRSWRPLRSWTAIRDPIPGTGQPYRDFHQLSDAEVLDHLARVARGAVCRRGYAVDSRCARVPFVG